ncbi:hypothetical protein BGZ76_010859 [Entomortierella beljakovae]|nr:hypothetical protein BGZ76_010859 [Entomortierella beljakovae]
MNRAVTIECNETTILPFGDKYHESQFSKDRTSHSEAFEVALKLAAEAQIEDDDDLPGWDDIMIGLSTAPKPTTSTTTSTVQKKKQGTFLAIPGELILAWSDRFYYPGRIASFNTKTNKYKVDYATGHSQSIERKKFFTRYEKGFQTCPLGALALPSAVFHYEDKELENQVSALHPELYAIIAGREDKAGRLDAFLQGGRLRRTLAQRVGPGSFGRGEYGLIGSLLQSEFLPDLITTKNPNIKSKDKHPMKEEGDVTKDFSDQLRLHFVTDVLLPETITRLTMERNKISYEEADKQILECKRDENEDTWWVDDVLAARESFLDGKER